jgi:hypothetical protein
MHYLKLTTYNHTLFYNGKVLLPPQGLPERANLDDNFQGRGIGKNRTLPWPPFSLPFFVWGYFKRTVYQSPFAGIGDLKKRSH